MTNLEMVEKLRARANVSYDEAKAALDACGGDLLEAMIYLEKQGKVPPPQDEGYYSTYREQFGGDGAAPEHARVHAQVNGERFGSAMKRFGRWCLRMLHKGNVNQFEIRHRGEVFLSLPMTAFILLLLVGFWFLLVALVIGLFCGCTYRVRGPQLEDSSVNDMMDGAAKAADSLKKEVLHPEEDDMDDDLFRKDTK